MMRRFASAAFLLAVSSVFAQNQTEQIAPQRPRGPILIRPYTAPTVPPAPESSPGRFADLIRAGRMYLTAQDAIALALENNIDIAVARYTPIDLAWTLERYQAGGTLPGVPNNASQAISVASGQGVLGSQQAAGVNIAGNNGQVGANTNTTVAQIGPVTPTLDPSFQQASTFSHRSLPQPNFVQSLTPNLVLNQRVYLGQYQQGYLLGGTVTMSYNDHYLRENALTDNLNPSSATSISVSVQQNLLSGFGSRVNGRSIEVAKINLNASDLNFKSTVSTVIANVLYAYYTLSADFDDLRAKVDAVNTAQTVLNEDRRRLELGALAQLDVITAQNELAQSREALVNSESSMRQDELALKNLISRMGVGDPVIGEAQIVPLDRITVPAEDMTATPSELMKVALANRSDLASDAANLKASEASAVGTKSGLLPLGVGLVSTSVNGLSGTPKTVPEGIGGIGPADPYFIGGMGTALGQMFRHNFPSESAGAFFRASIGNRQAQADYGVDQLSLRQQALSNAKDAHQAQVDVMNAWVAMQQARARYEAAVQSRILSQQLLEGERKKFAVGESTAANVAAQQRDLLAAQASELDAGVSWRYGKIALDQATGTTMEANHVTMAEAKSGQPAGPAALPAQLPPAAVRDTGIGELPR